MKHQAGIAAVAAIIAGSLIAGFMSASDFLKGDAHSAYVTAPARIQDVELTILSSATIEPRTIVNVGAQVSGQLVSLTVEVGDKVTQGQLLGQIDSVPQQNKLRNAEAALANVRAQRLVRIAGLRKAQLDLARQQQMWSADATPREELEAAQAVLDVTRAEIESLDAQIRQAEITVDIARTDLGYTRITAPIDGVVVAVVTEGGRTVNANQSAPTIVMLAQLDVMRVKAEISEADVTRVQPGQSVYFTTLGQPQKRHHAVLRAVEPAPASIALKADASSANAVRDSAAVYYNGLFEMPNPEGELRPSMTAQVYIVLDEARQVVAIPSSALQERAGDGKYIVRVLDAGGHSVARSVQIGLNNNVAAQVLEGIRPGENVIIADAAAADSGRGK